MTLNLDDISGLRSVYYVLAMVSLLRDIRYFNARQNSNSDIKSNKPSKI
jgi:hypothetical protein